LVIAKSVDFTSDDPPALVLASSDGLDWIAGRGLMYAAQYVLDQKSVERDD
jgi:hypothetical protein